MTTTFLVSDNRERAIHGCIDVIFKDTEFIHKKCQLNTGDYLIYQKHGQEKPNLVACIERKTLKDFAASIKDGRCNNVKKMIDLRNKTGCQLYILIEGNQFPNPDRKIGGILCKSILSAIDSLMIRDGFNSIYTKDEMGTAHKLLNFLKTFKRIGDPFMHPYDETDNIQDTTIIGSSETTVIEIPKELTTVIGKSDDELVIDMWAKLTGISISTAKNIAVIYSISEYINNPEIDNSKLKTSSGRNLVKSGINSLSNLRNHKCKKTACKILSVVPGISLKTATTLLSKTTLLKLILDHVDELKEIDIEQKNRTIKLGIQKVKRIKKLLSHKIII